SARCAPRRRSSRTRGRRRRWRRCAPKKHERARNRHAECTSASWSSTTTATCASPSSTRCVRASSRPHGRGPPKRRSRDFAKSAMPHASLREEVRRLHHALHHGSKDDEMIGDGPAIRQTMEIVERVARTDSAVLVVGESGTGKELVARTLHAKSGKKGAFVGI